VPTAEWMTAAASRDPRARGLRAAHPELLPVVGAGVRRRRADGLPARLRVDPGTHRP